MPVWLRRTTFNMMREYYDKQNEETERQNNILKNVGKKDIIRPNIAPPSPNYVAKAPKK